MEDDVLFLSQNDNDKENPKLPLDALKTVASLDAIS